MAGFKGAPIVARSVRVAPVLLVWVLVATSPLAAAQGTDPGLRAAVAPAQLLFDAAADVVDLAVSEATRDGTPDQAVELRKRAEAFAAALSEGWALSAQATHRDATMAALPVARRLPIVLGDVTDDVARLATATERCERALLKEEDLAAIAASRALVQATGKELLATARSPPPGVDGRRLEGASSSLLTWSASFEAVRECPTVAPGGDRSFLVLQVQPSLIHPTGTVRLRGVTSDPGPVAISSPDLGLEVSLDLVEQAFEHTFAVPLSAEHGTIALRARAGNMTATRLLEVQPASSTLLVSGPTTADVGALVNYTVRLTSEAAEHVANATLDLTGDVRQRLQLQDGRANLTLRAPASSATVRFRVSFAGDHVVAPSSRDVTLLVATAAQPPRPAPTGNGTNATNGTTFDVGPRGEGSTGGRGLGDGAPLPAAVAVPPPEVAPAPWDVYLELAALVVLLLLVAWAVHGRLPFAMPRFGRAPQHAPARPSAGPAAAALPVPARLAPFRGGIVAHVSRLARLFRRRGTLPPGATARTMRPMLRELGLDDAQVVSSFERVRYGEEPEPPWTQRLRTRFRTAWTRVRGGEAR